MCLELSKNSKVQIAKHSVVVYKKLEEAYTYVSEKRKFYSPFMNFPYVLGKRYAVRSFKDSKNRVSFRTKIPATAIQVDVGLHAYVTLEEASQHWLHMHTVVRCVIPKGTPYIRGTNGEVVSLALIPKEVVKWS